MVVLPAALNLKCFRCHTIDSEPIETGFSHKQVYSMRLVIDGHFKVFGILPKVVFYSIHVLIPACFLNKDSFSNCSNNLMIES